MTSTFQLLAGFLLSNWLLAGVVILSVQCFAIVAITRLITSVGLLSSAWNHRVWVCAIILLIGLVPACFYLPNGLIAKIPIPSPRQPQTETPTQDLPNRTPFPVVGQIENELAKDQLGEDRVSAANVVSNDQATRTSLDSSSAAVSQQPHAVIASTFSKPVSQSFGLLLWIYFGGAAFLISRLVVGWVRLKSLGHGAASLERSSLEMASELAEKLELRRLPKFAVSSNVVAPMSWGILKPQVLLPESFHEWSQECRQAVLAHELSHIVRRDSLFDLLSRISSTIYWFHPAIHYASRQLDSAREEATDERVLACGILPETYARQLIAVLERCTLSNRSFLPTAVGMAKSSTLESRIRRILAKRNIRSKPWPITRRFALALTVVCLLVVAMPFRLVSSFQGTVDADENPSFQANESVFGQTQSMTLFERFQNAKVENLAGATETITIEGVVFDPSGKPAADAIVVGYLQSMEDVIEISGKTTTDAAGRYTLTCTKPTMDRFALQVVAVDSQNHLGWFDHLSDWKVSNRSIRLKEWVGHIEGVLMEPNGKPLADVEVQATVFFVSQIRQEGSQFRPNGSYSPLTCNRKIIDFNTKTNADGRFELNGLPADFTGLRLKSDQWEVLPTLIDNSEVHSRDKVGTRHGLVNILHNPAVLNAFPIMRQSVRVINSGGKPIVGARIESHGTSDAEGIVSLRLPDLGSWEASEDRTFSFEVKPPAGSPLLTTQLLMTREQIAKREVQTVVLEGEWVSGRILSSQTKRPLPNICVRTKNFTHMDKKVLSDAEGKFRILVKPGQLDLDFVPDGLLPEEERRYMSETAQRRASRQFDILSGESVDIGVVMLNYLQSDTKRVSIQVVLDGNPAADCSLQLFHTEGPGKGTFHASLRVDDKIASSTSTDQNGFADIQPMLGWESKSMILASYPASKPTHFGVAKLESGTLEVSPPLRLEEAAVITGRVMLNGKPQSGSSVTASYDTTPPRLQMPNTRFESSQTDADGRYAINVLPNGWYHLSLNWNGQYSGELGIGRNIMGPKKGSETIVHDIALVTGDEVISGKVVDEAGKPVPGVGVSLVYDFDIGQTLLGVNNGVTSRDGAFRVTGLPAGTYRLTAILGFEDKERVERVRARRPSHRQAKIEATTGQSDVIVVLPD